MNMKNIRDRLAKKINRQSIKLFLQKQGLYVLIFLCVAAAGITAIVAWPRDDAGQQQISESETGASVIEGDTLEDELAANATQSPTASPTQTAAPSTPTATNNTASNGSGAITLKKPVDGKIINKFSGDKLVFFASLNLWETHNGVDIKADAGAPVVAALSGTVSDVYTNEADGGVIVLSHSDSTQTVYAGLDEQLVKEGDKVNAGQEIGTVGKMPKEMDLSYHLHFEYIVDNVWKNPESYFEK